MKAHYGTEGRRDLTSMSLDTIPSAMRSMGWNVAAALMDRWLRSPAWRMPASWKQQATQPLATTLSPRHVDTTIVRMDWAKKFGRCHVAMSELRGKIDNPAAVTRLRQLVMQRPWDKSDSLVFGYKGMSVLDFDDACQVNSVGIGDRFGTMDDMYGALGRATAKVGVVGTAEKNQSTGRLALHATHAGFYLRDNYDFNGFQFLGHWTTSGVRNKLQMMAYALFGDYMSGDPVSLGNVFNHHFSDYRCARGLGGDFVIYSDVLWEPLDIWVDLGPLA
jgi:hypothetical protein